MKGNMIACTGLGKVDILEDEILEPAADEIRIKVLVSFVSPGTEAANILRKETTRYPRTFGYCKAGIIEKIGSNVTRFKVGDLVTGKNPGHRSHWITHEKDVLPVPEEMPLEYAAAVNLGAIALQGIRKARIELGETVMVLGLGIIGQLALKYASLSGAYTIGVDLAASRLNKAKEYGCDFVVNATEPDWLEQVKELTGGKGPQVVIEVTGNADAVPMAFKAAGKQGRVVLLGSNRGKQSTVSFFEDVHSKGLIILGAQSFPSNPLHDSTPGRWTWMDDANCYLELVNRDKLSPEPLISERVQLDDALDVYKRILERDESIIGTAIFWP